MKCCETIEELRSTLQVWRCSHPDGSIGFVPTMGFLHEGHASLIRRSAEENQLTVVSIFVNPLQFGPNEDFERYPRDPERDTRLAEEAGADILFMPSVKEMYPKPVVTKVMISGLTDKLCGASRPGHFDGVGTVVSKLFNLVQPDAAYFGQKDAQQVAVIERMVEDLNIPVTIVACPIVREADGLAMSSRNVYLTPEERAQAVVLSHSLQRAEAWFDEPDLTVGEIRRRIAEHISSSSPLAEIDYTDILSYPDLENPSQDVPIGDLPGSSRYIAALAVKFGATRLIDNRIYTVKGR
ncbi:pantoate--beta-alanine ligase [Paenibacillus sambharensis]|uniref:Pantothenate synthetase n=1 Tax=Paenibacillus sambharensis TaxID=1803190 RepID=A0A2W1L2I6_9BACL|nr:pantoate--beta-alanine ligase [Paenibacillus sambharensis]PZD93566.1 pantoate--beta-alanine ligase [Paenibacillus sambharensis]